MFCNFELLRLLTSDNEVTTTSVAPEFRFSCQMQSSLTRYCSKVETESRLHLTFIPNWNNPLDILQLKIIQKQLC